LGDKNFFQSIVDGTDKNPWVTPEKAQEILNKYYGPQNMAEAAQGHTIEAHGVRGMDRRTWHKTFRNTDQMIAWAEKHDAEIVGTRDLEQARHHNLSPAQQGITEMDKSQPSAGRDTGPRSGPEKIAKPITPEKMVKHALDTLTKSMAKKDDKKKGVAEATDSATSNLIWKAMNYLPHDRPKDMEDILVQIAHNQGPVTRVTDDPEKLASLVQAVWMDGQTRKQKVGQQGMAESNVFTDARMNAIKADQDTFVVHGKTYQVTGDTSDERQAGLAEDSIAAMRRLAGIVPQVPLIVSNGQRQYRHMPTAVQPR